MYFLFVNNDNDDVLAFEKILHTIDSKKILITVANGYDLIQFLQNVKKDESYPDLIVLTPKFLRLNGMDLLELLKTDDMYCLIPVVMLLPENNFDQETVCNRFGAEFMLSPKDQGEWMSTVKKMCAICS
jgi:CheY-like chemotaxis protein